ncbi:hypothetical protein [Paraburkholderia sp. BL10I2N1]|uniref:hypothetical protein n=1 Tax=Paraburkholderia sp. BL10I2N1 TaxID=1938796 RepID=UPI00106209D2|nr:hypothetical protein [Paraburkholderia sp. BL10I2N1]TDN59064.1 hypothetical protein B0G77_8252 [Paraburkholderia sp. BL10I2N1]
MLPILRLVLQDALKLTSYAGTPVIQRQTPPDDAWIADLRRRADNLYRPLKEALDHLAAVDTNAEPTGWTPIEQALFSQWMNRTYPNEASAGTIALGEAWKEGNRIGAADLALYKDMYMRLARDMSRVRHALGVNDELAGWCQPLLDAIIVLQSTSPHEVTQEAACK